jgi:diaminohydroxyphosphoribosylaminopyrimidine deaminase/5-amino-6-(5-phosphoribosylamino)uracil reductase
MTDIDWMRLALRLALKGYGHTSPNPVVGAVLVKKGREIGHGWHRRAGAPHAEIEALNDARQRAIKINGATLYVTLEPCSTHGRTPPCTEAIRTAGIRRIVVGTVDPNPRHAGRGLALLRRFGITVETGLLESECTALNEAFNHWIVQRTPFVTVKAAMTLDGKIATATGESRWITGPRARAHAQRLRLGHDAILVGIGTVLEDNPQLSFRPAHQAADESKVLRRIVLDSRARTPLDAQLVQHDPQRTTTIVVTSRAPAKRANALAKQVRVVRAPSRRGRIDLEWLLRYLGGEAVTSLLVEGGSEVQSSFLLGGFAQRVAFYYAPKILGGRRDHKAVAGPGARRWNEIVQLDQLRYRSLGPDLFLTARVLRRADSPDD